MKLSSSKLLIQTFAARLSQESHSAITYDIRINIHFVPPKAFVIQIE